LIPDGIDTWISPSRMRELIKIQLRKRHCADFVAIISHGAAKNTFFSEFYEDFEADYVSILQ